MCVSGVRVSKAVLEIEPKVIEWRRDFHMHPEIGMLEFRTSEKVQAHLSALGIPFKVYAGTGVVGLLDSGKPGPTVMLRADMDALPVEEENDIQYKSQNPGCMHACGHDTHMAMLMGIAQVLKNEGLSRGRVKFCFQPGEEGRDGAKLMIADGLFRDEPVPDVALGMHIWNNLPAGEVAVLDGPCMASVDEFEIFVRGVGGHAAYPHQTVDPIVISAQIITAMQSIVSRTVAPMDKAVLSICEVHGGTAFNIIPPEVVLRGTVRTFLPETEAAIRRQVEEMPPAIAKSMGGEAEVNYIVKLPSTINDPKVAGFARRIAAGIVGDAKVVDTEPSMGGEDFSLFGRQVPAAFVFLGSRNPEKDATMPHHHPKFNVDEDMFKVGVELGVRFAREWG
ncbi:MAG: amidohydrolase [bacterium]|jgi:amidohydrolase